MGENESQLFYDFFYSLRKMRTYHQYHIRLAIFFKQILNFIKEVNNKKIKDSKLSQLSQTYESFQKSNFKI